MTRVVAIVQARVGSTRLPGKVLRDLAGRPMVVRVLERAARTAGIDAVVAAVPDLGEDDALVSVLENAGVHVVRGPADDVLHRYVLASRASNATAVVRITSDCPLLSPTVSGLVVSAFLRDEPDYASNTIERTWPRGLDTEVIAASTLEELDAGRRSAAEREHVTAAIWQNPDAYRLRSVRNSRDLSHLRWTVDTHADLAFVRAVYSELADPDAFELHDVLAVLAAHPGLASLNAHVEQKSVDR